MFASYNALSAHDSTRRNSLGRRLPSINITSTPHFSPNRTLSSFRPRKRTPPGEISLSLSTFSIFLSLQNQISTKRTKTSKKNHKTRTNLSLLLLKIEYLFANPNPSFKLLSYFRSSDRSPWTCDSPTLRRKSPRSASSSSASSAPMRL